MLSAAADKGDDLDDVPVRDGGMGVRRATDDGAVELDGDTAQVDLEVGEQGRDRQAGGELPGVAIERDGDGAAGSGAAGCGCAWVVVLHASPRIGQKTARILV